MTVSPSELLKKYPTFDAKGNRTDIEVPAEKKSQPLTGTSQQPSTTKKTNRQRPPQRF